MKTKKPTKKTAPQTDATTWSEWAEHHKGEIANAMFVAEMGIQAFASKAIEQRAYEDLGRIAGALHHFKTHSELISEKLGEVI